MSVWDEVDRFARKSQSDFLKTKAELEELGFKSFKVDDYGVWRARHRTHGEAKGRDGKELVAVAKRIAGA